MPAVSMVYEIFFSMAMALLVTPLLPPPAAATRRATLLPADAGMPLPPLRAVSPLRFCRCRYMSPCRRALMSFSPLHAKPAAMLLSPAALLLYYAISPPPMPLRLITCYATPLLLRFSRRRRRYARSACLIIAITDDVDALMPRC